MNNNIFKVNNVIYKKVDKRVAFNHFYNGKTVYLMPCKYETAQDFIIESIGINNAMGAFNRLIFDFKDKFCTSVKSGYNVSFYLEMPKAAQDIKKKTYFVADDNGTIYGHDLDIATARNVQAIAIEDNGNNLNIEIIESEEM